jgi:hypothetical protein
VNPLSLGMVDTSIIDGRFKSKEGIDSARAFLSGITLVGRIGRSEETASAILFLASTRVIFLLGSIWRRLTASRRSELGGSARALRNLREVQAMQQQTAYSSWITVPVR